MAKSKYGLVRQGILALAGSCSIPICSFDSEPGRCLDTHRLTRNVPKGGEGGCWAALPSPPFGNPFLTNFGLVGTWDVCSLCWQTLVLKLISEFPKPRKRPQLVTRQLQPALEVGHKSPNMSFGLFRIRHLSLKVHHIS